MWCEEAVVKGPEVKAWDKFRDPDWLVYESQQLESLHVHLPGLGVRALIYSPRSVRFQLRYPPSDKRPFQSFLPFS